MVGLSGMGELWTGNISSRTGEQPLKQASNWCKGALAEHDPLPLVGSGLWWCDLDCAVLKPTYSEL